MRLLPLLVVALIVVSCATLARTDASARFVIENLNWNLANVTFECATNGRTLKRVWNIPTGDVHRGRLAFGTCQDVRALVSFVGSREEVRLDLIGWNERSEVIVTVANVLTFSTYRVR